MMAIGTPSVEMDAGAKLCIECLPDSDIWGV